MPTILLPASAAAFAPRSTCNVVLNSKVEPWLTATLKRINKIKRPSQQCTATYQMPDGDTVITQCDMVAVFHHDPQGTGLPNYARTRTHLIEALFNYQLVARIEAYVVHIDMVSQNEVAFKLTQDTIDSLG